MNTLENVKIVIGINDNKDDKLLETIINSVEKKLLSMLPRDTQDIPERIKWIVEEVTVKRYNRRGAEGMTAESVEGRSNTFQVNEFEEYAAIINDFKEIDESKNGSVMFY